MLFELIKGVSLLLALCYLQTFNGRLWGHRKIAQAVATGVLFGAICVVGMNLPIVLTQGVIFDARSVLLSMAGMFGGPVVGIVAGIIAGGYRIWLGGNGVYVGTAVVVSCVALGLAFRYLRMRGKVEVGIVQLLVFGLLVHLVVVLLFTQLPAPTAERVMQEIAIPFVLTFTPATALLGLLLLDIENRQSTEQALRDSEARLSLHLQNTPLAAISWDRDFRTTQWNTAAEEMFGYTAEEAIGRHAADLIVPDGIAAELGGVFESLLNGTTENARRNANENCTKDGRTIKCEWYNTPIRDRSGQPVGVASLALDVTDRLRTARDLHRALIAAEAANQAKSDFLARLSHEFRTPLNAILGFSEVLQMKFFGPLGNEKYEEYASGIHDSGEHLLELINDVLDISAIEAGKRTILKEPLDLDAIVAESLELVRTAAQRRDIQLRVDLPADLPTLFADRRAVKQILLNLLSNGVKFSEAGGEVSTRAFATDETMTIEIADNGIGIEPEILPTVTDVFSRGSANAHLAQEGSGLGLAIVKSLVEAHDGSLTIESEVGRGTTARIVLPLGAADAVEKRDTDEAA